MQILLHVRAWQSLLCTTFSTLRTLELQKYTQNKGAFQDKVRYMKGVSMWFSYDMCLFSGDYISSVVLELAPDTSFESHPKILHYNPFMGE